MALLEREQALADVRSRLDDASKGRGSIVLLTGAAGLGKTSVSREAFAHRPERIPGWWGQCDPLSTPRPLGPLHDIARQHPVVAAAMADGEACAGQLLQLLRQPTMVVVEDTHWLDEATADVLVHLARRSDQLRSVVVLTFRDEEHHTDHPMTRVLGSLAGKPTTHRIVLSPLSREAVQSMIAGTSLDVDEVVRVSGGNPFFVRELATDPTSEIPESVTAAVMARVNTLDEASRSAIELTSLSPDGLDYELIVQILDEDRAAAGVDAAAALGLLTIEQGRVRFNHELTRLAVLGAVSPSQLRRGHRVLLDALEDDPNTNAARLAARRNEPAAGLLGEAVDILGEGDDLHFLWPVAAAIGEVSWLGTDVGSQLGVLDRTLELACRMEYPWLIGELGYLRWLHEPAQPVREGSAEPWLMMTDGRWREAAAAWDERNSPFEHARSLALGDEAAMRRSLAILDGLGAAAVADRVRAELRELGATNVPRRPTATTTDGLLTDRQVDVLRLVAEGMTNAQVAERLFLSTKTVGHHVSAILQRLEVKTRTEAAVVAQERGLLE